MYISNDGGVSNSYNSGSTSYVYAYREINVTSTNYYFIDFDWMAYGEDNYDNLRFFIIPTSLNPNLTGGAPNDMSNNINTNPAGWNDVGLGILTNMSDWQHAHIETIIEADSYYLVFFWKNDGSAGNNPSGTIDNIEVSKTPGPFVVSSVSNIRSTSAILHGIINDSGSTEVIERGFWYGTDSDNLTEEITITDVSDEFSSEVTGLAPNTTYYYRAYATNSDGTGYSEIKSFTTPSGQQGDYCYVDLGLPSKTYWASMNIGATNPEDMGEYFAWGETTPKDTYEWSTYRYCNGSDESMTKYCNNPDFGNNGFTDDLTTLEASDDAATANWGSGWRMPIADEAKELYTYCSHVWTTQSGVTGRLFTGPNGNSIFLPGIYNSMSNHYWTNSLYSSYPSEATTLIFGSGTTAELSNYYRYDGLPVRAVYRVAPYLATVSQSNVTLSSATLSGLSYDNGNSDVIERGFQYGTNPDNLTETIQSELGANEFTATLTGLAPNTTYYYRAYATNSDDTGYGEIKSFTTPSGQLGDHYFVNLSLPSGTMWATCNVGGTNPEDIGNEYAWGETTTKDEYTQNNYTYSDNPATLPAEADAAAVNWGEDWIMPTQADIQELIDYCDTTWITFNGIRGIRVTSSNGNSIFIPTDIYEGYSTYASYWSSSLDTNNPTSAMYMSMYSGDSESDSDVSISDMGRTNPARVRPVYKVTPTAFELGDEPYICDFENGDENTNWLFGNGNELNRWYIGNGANNGGNKGLYISNDGGNSNTYINEESSNVYAYRSIQINESDIYQIRFDWRAAGLIFYGYKVDLLRAFLIPETLAPDLTGGNNNGMLDLYSGIFNATPDGWIEVSESGEPLLDESEWQTSMKEMAIEAGAYKLVFFWQNVKDEDVDGESVNNPPAAIDNISIMKIACPMIANLNATGITTESATINWTELGSAESWKIIVSETELDDDELEVAVPTATVSSPSYSATGLSSATTYYVYVMAICSDTENSSWKKIYFRTSICPAEDMCEISYQLADSYGDGWSGCAINVVDAETGIVLATWTIEDGSSARGTLAVCDGREITFEYVEGSYSDETSYQVFYSNGDELFSGSDVMDSPQSYIITCPPPVDVTTQRATSTSTTATLAGEVTISRVANVNQVGFEYGESEDVLSETVTVAYSENNFTAQITGLTPQTIYYYRAFAIYNDDITAYGEVLSFRTKENDTEGTEDNPLTIDNAEEWGQFAEAMYLSENRAVSTYKGYDVYNSGEDVYFKLTSDIDISEPQITIRWFNGYLKGDGNTILSKSALFDNIGNGSVEDINIIISESIVLSEHEVYTPFGIVSSIANSATISNCTVSGATGDVLINASYLGDLGCIVGQSNNSTITNCVNNLPITNDRIMASGIVGSIYGGSVTGCVNNAPMSAYYASGIAVYVSGGTLSSNLNAGKIIGKYGAGGIVFETPTGDVVVDGCMNIAEIYSTEKNSYGVRTGGIVASNEDAMLSIRNCANYGSFSNLSAHIGGIFGSIVAQLSSNVSAPIFIENSVDGNPYNSVYATIGATEEDFTSEITEEDDFFDEQISDLRVDSLRLRYASRGTGMQTSEVVGTALQSSLSGSWIFSDGLFPMPAGIPVNNKTTLARMPIYLANGEKSGGVMNNFTVPTSISGHEVTWESSNTSIISISSDGTATVTRPAFGAADEEVTLTATYEGETKTFVLLVVSPKHIPVFTEDPDVGDIVYFLGYIDSDVEGLPFLNEYGFIYSTNSNLSDSTKVVSTGIDEWGSFDYEVIGLEKGITYYVAAFASTADSTTYGEIKEFRIPGPPEITIGCPLNRTTTAMEVKVLNVVSDEEEDEPDVIMYYGTDRNNLTENVWISYDDDYHYYSAFFNNLQPATEYWFVAEISDSYGTSRSDTVAYYTYGTFTDDRDNTQYYTIQIGEQTWMAENLKYVGNLETSGDGSYTEPYLYYPNWDEENVETYGYQYNWVAAMNGEESSDKNPSGVQGICPEGWHLPSQAEWTQLINAIAETDAGSRLAGDDELWDNIDVFNLNYFGESGFAALPAGSWVGSEFDNNFGRVASFWTATGSDETTAFIFNVAYNTTYLGETDNEDGRSIRCLKGTTIYAYDTVKYCGEEYTFGTQTLTSSGDYEETFTLGTDKDSIVYLHLTMYPALTATISDFSNGCFGANNGYVEVSATGGAGTYSYNWSTPEMQTNARLSNLADGEYTVTVTDAVGCTATISQMIITPGQLTVSLNGDNQICEGSDANITANVEGGTENYSYRWSNGGSTQNTTVQEPGTYIVTVTDAAECTATGAIAVTVLPAATLELTSGTLTQNVCFGGNFITTVYTYGGSANGADVTGLPNGLSFNNNTSNKTIEITGTPIEAGSFDYTVTTTGATSPCTNQSITGTIIVYPQLTVTVSGNNPSCYGDVATITSNANGGTEPYIYNWSNSESSVSITDTPLANTEYSVTVTDSNGCAATASTNVTVPSQLTVSISGETTIRCYGETTDLTANANGGSMAMGYTYAWTGNVTGQNLTGVVAGNYTVTVSDGSGCSATASVAVTQPAAALTASIPNPTNVTCYGASDGSATVTADGGTEPYTYSWNNGADTQTVTNIAAGSHSVVVTDANGCTVDANVTITQPEELSVSLSAGEIGCNGGMTNITGTYNGGTSPYAYSWSNGATSQNLTDVTAGNYSVVVTDNNGCTAAASVTITQPDALTASLTAGEIGCNGGTTNITSDVNGGTSPYAYSWSNSETSQDLTGVTVGDYNVVVTDRNGCTASTSATITQPTAISVSFGNTVAQTCAISGSVEFTISGGTGTISYAWDGGNASEYSTTSTANLTAGNHTISITDANGCSITDNVEIAADTVAPNVQISSTTTVLTCSVNSIPLQVSGAVSYLWSDGSTASTLTAESTGTYTVTATASNGCTATASSVITSDIEAPTVSITNTTNPETTELTCEISAITVTAVGSNRVVSYSWSGGTYTNQASNELTSAGTYTVTVTADNGCVETDQITITETTDRPHVEINAASTVLTCTTTSLTLNANGDAVNYTWSGGNPNGTENVVNETGTYTVVATAANGCTAISSITITEDITAPVISISNETGTSVINCSVSQINVTASGNGIASYAWADNQSNPSFSITSAGTYTVTATGENGCTSTSSIEITQDFASPQIAVSASPEIVCLGSSTTLTATGAVSYQWSPETDLSSATGSEVSATPSATTEYIVTGTGTNGCTASADITVTVSTQVTSDFDQSACYSFEWNGQTYTESGNYEQTLQTVNGCDSVVTLHLTINGTTTGTFEDSMCQGVPYEYNGQTFTEAGSYDVTLVNANGCDSIVTLTLTYADDCSGIVSGIITDAITDEVIPNARIIIGNVITRTNNDGEYTLSVLRGSWQMIVSATGYATYRETIDVQDNMEMNIELYMPRIAMDIDSILVTTYPYLAHNDSITITNTGNTMLVWSSLTDYENLELLPEEEEIHRNRNTRALWDSIQTFTTQFNAEQAIATDGFFIYTSSWQRPGEFNRYTPDGEYIETFFIENVGMIRNLSFDGTYFYGTEASNIIFKLDLNNQMIVDSIVTDINNIRHCSFDKQNGNLLAGDWNSLYSIDTASGESTQIRNDLLNVYSSTYDNLSPGGPYLWLFSQTSQDNGPSACIRQFSISSGEYTDKTHYLDDLGIGDASLAGGICASEYIENGKFVLLANVQNPSGNNTIATYEIGRTNNIVSTSRRSGELQPNESIMVGVREYVTETGDYNATIRYRIAVMGSQPNNIPIAVSSIAPECNAVQQITMVTDTFSTVTLNWQPVELGDYNSASYLVFGDNSEIAIDTTSEISITFDGLSVGEHCYSIRAMSVGEYTCISDASDTVCAEIQEYPCNMYITIESESDGESIFVEWNKPAGVEYFRISRDDGAIDEILYEDSYIDSDVTSETDYCYTVTGYLENGLCGEISSITCMRIVSGVCVDAPELKVETIGGSVVLSWTNTSDSRSYQIFRNDEPIGTTTDTTYYDKADDNGNYCYKVKSVCDYRMFAFSNEVCADVDGVAEWTEDNLSLYPNPTYGQFFIDGSHIATVRIFNASGQLVVEIENSETTHLEIDCNGWNPGIYNVQIISTEGNMAIRKVSIFR
ncbi:MAG: carboxypeptidase-like regulatory domain-containing protein [Bacteroidales bacterium]|nr:carboxypeptidase-like regulatory domain-containing protein [Bacteroidales bacterium]